jgi:hypothetical protein
MVKCGNCKGHHATIAEVKECFGMKRSAPPPREVRSADPFANLKPSIIGDELEQGTYTVVFDEETDDRITVRFKEPSWGKWKGTQLIEYLFGPDNTADFRRCGNRMEGGYRIWNAYKTQGRITKAVEYLVSATTEEKADAGLTYALKSNNCWRCNRELTVPASITRGLGPECAKILGVA